MFVLRVTEAGPRAIGADVVGATQDAPTEQLEAAACGGGSDELEAVGTARGAPQARLPGEAGGIAARSIAPAFRVPRRSTHGGCCPLYAIVEY